MADKNTPAPISEDSIDLLSDARKGKSRKFLMLVKGVDVVALTLFKKGSHTKHLTEAKKVGSGQVYFGVVTGQGLDLTFSLATADGFEKAPVKNTTLKEFLSEHADMTCKPEIEIVKACPLVLDADDPLVARFLELQGRAKQVTEAAPGRAGEFDEMCKKIVVVLDQDDNRGAVPLLDQLEKALASTSTSETTPQPVTGNDAQTFATRLAALKEKIAAAIKANLPISAQIKQLVDASSAAAKSGKFPTALAALDRIESQLTAIADIRKTLEQRMLGARPTLEKAVATGGTIVDELKRKLSEAGAFLRSGDLGGVLRGMDEFDGLAAKMGSSSPRSPVGDVLAIWREAKELADGQLNSFVDALRKSGDEYLVKVAEGGVHSFVEGPSRVYVTLQATLFEYQSASGEAKSAAAKKAIQAMTDYRKFLKSSQFLEVCDTNELCGPLTIRDTLNSALDRLERQLAS